MFGLLRRRKWERAGFQLYTTAVQAARDPYFYDRLAVPDTLDGRFDMIGLYVSLLIHRLRSAPRPGPDLAQAVFDAMFSDMDHNLREIGVSDMAVGKRMKAMWEAFHGRAQAYAAAVDAGDEEALAAAIARNVWRGGEPDSKARALAQLVASQAEHVAAQGLESLSVGRVDFLPLRRVAA